MASASTPSQSAVVQRRMRQTRESTYPMIPVETGVATILRLAAPKHEAVLSISDPKVRPVYGRGRCVKFVDSKHRVTWCAAPGICAGC